jgi:hypothetical protein
MKQKIQTQGIADVVAPTGPSTDVGALTESEILKIHSVNDFERRGFVFRGNHDGSDVYVDMATEKGVQEYKG